MANRMGGFIGRHRPPFARRRRLKRAARFFETRFLGPEGVLKYENKKEGSPGGSRHSPEAASPRPNPSGRASPFRF